jgi:signal recognition particle subunit SEC65
MESQNMRGHAALIITRSSGKAVPRRLLVDSIRAHPCSSVAEKIGGFLCIVQDVEHKTMITLSDA